MYKILQNIKMYNGAERHNFQAGDMYDFATFKKDVINSFVERKMIEPCNNCQEHSNMQEPSQEVVAEVKKVKKEKVSK